MITNRLVVPLLGKGSRFSDCGFTMPKPLIMVDCRTIIEHSMDSFDLSDETEIIFIVRTEHITNFGIDSFLLQKFSKNVKIVSVSEETRGSVESVLKARQFIEDELPLSIWCSDVYFENNLEKFKPSTLPINGTLNYVLTTKANSPSYSYIKTQDDFVVEVAEKKVISNHANLGYYSFSSGKLFCSYADRMIDENYKTNGEFFIAPIYNLLISDGLLVSHKEFEKCHFFGTPKELQFYKSCVLKDIKKSKIAISSDHSGYDLKNIMVELLEGHEFVDCGAYNDNSSDYVTYSKILIEQIKSGVCDFGFLFCRSANGQAIYANKYNFIRCAYVFDEWTAKHAIEHNCANVFAIPSQYVDKVMLRKIILTIFDSKFQGGRHENRVRQILDV
jgi:RpiB/LacA/LacB family sugar-phosphate isomerase